jgi:hypothetical protein
MALTGDSLTVRRMRASGVVIIAAVLTTLVTAGLAATFAVYSAGVLPRAVRHDLSTASGTTFLVSGSVDRGQVDQITSGLPGQVSRALGHIPFRFDSAVLSNPLGFVAGAPANRNVPIAEAAAFNGITAHAVLLTGHWPGPPRAGQPIPAALPETAATLLHVRPGAVIRMRDRDSNESVQFTITGLYRPRQASETDVAYGKLNDIGLAGASTSAGFTTYGPLTVNAAAFRGSLSVGAGAWLAQPDTSAIPQSDLDQVAGRLSALVQSLQSGNTLPSLSAVTSLPSVLTGTASDLRVARSLLAICAVLIVLLAAAALLLVARLLTEAREGELAMLTARGATRWQLARLTLAEAVPLSVVAAAGGGLAGIWLARLAAGAGSVSFGTALNQAWPVALLVAAGAVIIVLAPVLRTVSPGAARTRRGRSAAVAGISRAGADVALVVLAVLAGLELRRYSVLSTIGHGSGGLGVDPVLVLAPALALAGGTTAVLRLLPVAAKLGDRLAGRGRRLTAALASWQISRQPVRQGGAALLVVLAAATGALVIAQRQSWIGSGHDQAAFTAGADVRADAAQPLTPGQAGQLSRTPGVTAVMPVVSYPAASGMGQTLALDAGHAAGVTLLRSDQAPEPATELLRRITPHGAAPGLALPGRPTGIRLAAAIGPARLALDPVAVTVSVADPDGDVYQLAAGALPADGRTRTLTAELPGGTAIYPLRVIAVTASYQLPGHAPDSAAVFTVDDLAATGPGAARARPGTELRTWPATASSTSLTVDRASYPGPVGPTGTPAVATTTAPTSGSARTVRFAPGYGQVKPASSPGAITGTVSLTAPVAVAGPVPGLATRAFLTATKSHVGSVVEASVAGLTVGVKIVAAVTSWPAVSGPGGALIVDLGTVQNILAAAGQPPAQASQWWLATRAGTVPPGLGTRLPPGSAVTSAAGVASSLLSDPVSAVPQRALLAVALTAILLAVTGFCVSIAAGVRQRRAENALLAALGVPPGAAAGQLGLEKLLLSVPSALAGLALGVVLAELLVPALTLTTSAARPVPPVLIHFGWPQTLGLIVCVAVVPVLAAVLAMARRPDPAAALRAAEAA